MLLTVTVHSHRLWQYGITYSCSSYYVNYQFGLSNSEDLSRAGIPAPLGLSGKLFKGSPDKKGGDFLPAACATEAAQRANDKRSNNMMMMMMSTDCLFTVKVYKISEKS